MIPGFREKSAIIPTSGIPQQRIIISAWFCLILARIDFNVIFYLPAWIELCLKIGTQGYYYLPDIS